MLPAELETAFQFIIDNTKEMKIVNAAGESVAPRTFFQHPLLSPPYPISLASFNDYKGTPPILFPFNPRPHYTPTSHEQNQQFHTF
jgi:hypothetical protein